MSGRLMARSLSRYDESRLFRHDWAHHSCPSRLGCGRTSATCSTPTKGAITARSNFARRIFRPAVDGRYQPARGQPARLVIADASEWPGHPTAAWPLAQPGNARRYTHVSDTMRTQLKQALQTRSEKSLRDRAAIAPHVPVRLLDGLFAPYRETPAKMISQIPPSHQQDAARQLR